MRSFIPRASALAIAAVMALCGCAADANGAKPSASPTSTTPTPPDPNARISTGTCQAEFPIRDGAGNPIEIHRRLSITDAKPAVEGQQYEELPVTPPVAYRSASDVMGAFAPMTDGTLLAGILPPHPTVEGQPGPQDTPGYYDGQFHAFAGSPLTPDGQPRSMGGGDAQGLSVAWMEQESSSWMPSVDWVIYAAQAPSYAQTLLAQSPGVDYSGDLAPYGYPTVPTVGSTMTYWATAYPTGEPDTDGVPARSGSKIQGRATDASEPVVDVADHAYGPSADGDAVYYLRDNWSEPTMSQSEYRIFRQPVDGPEQLVVSGEQGFTGAVTGPSAQNGVVAWVVAGSLVGATWPADASISQMAAGCSIVYLLDTATMSLTAIDVPDDSGLGSRLVGGSPIASWTTSDPQGNPSATYVYDSATGSLWTLSDNAAYDWPSINNDHILWFTTQPGADSTVVAHNSVWLGG